MPRLSITGPHGYHCEADPQGGGLIEHDTFTCGHGGGHIVLQRRDTQIAWCKRCMMIVCEYHAQFGACGTPENPNNQEFLELIESKLRWREL